MDRNRWQWPAINGNERIIAADGNRWQSAQDCHLLPAIAKLMEMTVIFWIAAYASRYTIDRLLRYRDTRGHRIAVYMPSWKCAVYPRAPRFGDVQSNS